MDTDTRRPHGPRNAPIALVLIALTLSASTGRAAGDVGDDTRAGRHVRTLDSRFDALFAEGARRSLTFRTLVDRLNQSTVFVYVEYRLLSGNLRGRLTFVGKAREQPWRYLRIEIECRQSTVSQIAALGHELQHAVEIADAAAAVDPRSIQALYGTIGFATDNSRRRFETDAARAAGDRVRHELLSRPTEGAGATTSYGVP
jgi:hypothetical protein